MSELVDLVVSNGIGVACIVYFMFRDYKFMASLQDTLSSLRDATKLIQDFLIEEVKDD